MEDILNIVDNFATERRTEFPILLRYPSWSYLDNAATSQKPYQLIQFFNNFWSERNAPLHRGVYRLSAELTKSYENVRKKVATFIGSKRSDEIIFCKGATEAINMVAHSFVEPRLQPGDNIVISALEHHANFVPWQQLCKKIGAELRIIPVKINSIAGAYREHLQCSLDREEAEKLCDHRTKFMALNHVSNVLGIINPAEKLCELAKAKEIPILLDGAQAVVHNTEQGRVNVAALGCDFYVFSGHKLYGPDGVGVLYGRRELLEEMPPYQTGGNMIEFVSPETCSFASPPQRFEAGTMPASAVLGLEIAIDYFCSLSQKKLYLHESELLRHMTQAIRCSPEFQKVKIIGDEVDLSTKIGVLSFVIDGVHPHDIGSILDNANVAIRAGHHCAQPLMTHLGLPATARVSLAVYNSITDVEQFCAGLEKVIQTMLN